MMSLPAGFPPPIARDPRPGLRKTQASPVSSYIPWQQWAKLTHADVVAFFAHPDDEIFSSGALSAWAKQGQRVQLVYFTQGNGVLARDITNPAIKGNALGQKRMGELTQALHTLGILNPPLVVGLQDGETTEHIAMMRDWVKTVLLKTQPHTVITMNPQDGVTDHVDHKSVGRAVDLGIQALLDEYQQQNAQGAVDPTLHGALWRLNQGAGLLHSGLSQAALGAFTQSFPPGDSSWVGLKANPAINTQLPVPASLRAQKIAALKAHGSQFPQSDYHGFDGFYGRYPWEDFERLPIGPGVTLPGARDPLALAPLHGLFEPPSSPKTAADPEASIPTPQMPNLRFERVVSPQSTAALNANPSILLAPEGMANQGLHGHHQHPTLTAELLSVMNPVPQNHGLPSGDKRVHRSAFRRFMEAFVMIAPMVTLLGATGIMAGSGLKGLSAFKNSKFLQELEPLGWKIISGGTIFTNLNGISAGLVSQQPAMFLANVIQLIGAPFLASKNQKVNALARALNFAGGGLFTLGFANEMVNKAEGDSRHERRTFSMDDFKAVFRRTSGQSPTERVTNFVVEIVNMIGFTLEDHWVMAKETVQDVKNFFKPSPNLDADSQDSWLTRLSRPSATVSRLSVVLNYVSTLPLLLFAMGKPQLFENKLLNGIRFLAGLTANVSLMALALQRDDWKGKAPLLGVPMSVLGSSMVKSSFMGGLGNAGEGLLNVFQSDVALNGLNKNQEVRKKKETP